MLDNPHHVYDRKDKDPDHVQEMPEQTKERQSLDARRCQAFSHHLYKDNKQPQQADVDVLSIGRDKREDGRKKTTPLPTAAFSNQVSKFAQLHR